MSRIVGFVNVDDDFWWGVWGAYHTLANSKKRVSYPVAQDESVISNDVIKNVLNEDKHVQLTKGKRTGISYGVVLESVGKSTFMENYLSECRKQALLQGIDFPTVKSMRSNKEEFENSKHLIYDVIGDFSVINIKCEGKEYYIFTKAYEDVKEGTLRIWPKLKLEDGSSVPVRGLALSKLCSCSLDFVKKLVDLRVDVCEDEKGNRFCRMIVPTLLGLPKVKEVVRGDNHGWMMANVLRRRGRRFIKDADKCLFKEKRALIDSFSVGGYSVRHIHDNGSESADLEDRISISTYTSNGDGKYKKVTDTLYKDMEGNEKLFVSEIIELYNMNERPLKEVFVLGNNCSYLMELQNEDGEWTAVLC